MPESERTGADEQEDVLAKKDHVTKSSIGLQRWNDEPMGEASGDAGSGTAERAARIAKGQHEAQDEERQD